ncbi:MAG TPA: DegT/DnrJ/EryC1/StrS family aminotransferase, partial [Chloroflexota bacterium]|nr:DegT/DnrJ/EryC1/StrS family aminotransferase [Chloroflexota bacterium]
KIVTTGEGGMLVTNNPELHQLARQLANQGEDPHRHYWFPMVGYNYRMTNIQAAIGLAQLERVEWHMQRRREVAELYRELLDPSGKVVVPWEPQGAHSVFWMSCALVRPGAGITRDALMAGLDEQGVETRPYFPPMHQLPIYSADNQRSFPVAEGLSQRGLNLPSSALLDESDVRTVCSRLLALLDRATSRLA